MKNPPPDQLTDRLTNYPHVVEEIQAIWGSAACRAYMIGLVTQDRDGLRQGFPFDAFNAIRDLIDLHDVLFPHWQPARPFTPWSKR